MSAHIATIRRVMIPDACCSVPPEPVLVLPLSQTVLVTLE